jgi:rod shape-determining protein MreC
MKSFSPRFWQSATLILIVVGIIMLALSGALTPVLNQALNPFIAIQRWFSTRYMAVYEFITVPRDVNTLREQNASLQEQVARLQTEVIQLQQQLSESQVLYALLDYSRARPDNKYKAAAVIGRDPNPFLRYIIIDQGSDDGIRHGMPVVTQQGLVGRIDAVTAGASRVQLITDAASIVNVQMQKAKISAQLTGSITGEVSVDMIPQDASLAQGELVLTSGLGGSYPAGIQVGQIVSVQKRTGELYQTAAVQPVVDFTNLQAVLVITNFKPVDIVPLQPTPGP